MGKVDKCALMNPFRAQMKPDHHTNMVTHTHQLSAMPAFFS
uniref:Uncharacterized protein n=1 Tax=Rhizophora mucronata TaxID=61149 RepID=A0A2P2Q5I0_RHIMU